MLRLTIGIQVIENNNGVGKKFTSAWFCQYVFFKSVLSQSNMSSLCFPRRHYRGLILSQSDVIRVSHIFPAGLRWGRLFIHFFLPACFRGGQSPHLYRRPLFDFNKQLLFLSYFVLVGTVLNTPLRSTSKHENTEFDVICALHTQIQWWTHQTCWKHNFPAAEKIKGLLRTIKCSLSDKMTQLPTFLNSNAQQ